MVKAHMHREFLKTNILTSSLRVSWFLRNIEGTVHWLLHSVWQHVGDNFWQHCDNRGEWEKHTEPIQPIHPGDLEAGAGQPSAAGRRCSLPGCRIPSQQCRPLHTHRPLSLHVHHPAPPSRCVSPWEYRTDGHDWQGRWWFGHLLWSWRWWLHEWWGHSWEKPEGWWHQQRVSSTFSPFELMHAW